MHRVIITAFEIDEGASDAAVRIKAPGGWIGRRAGKQAGGSHFAEAAPKVAAIDGIEAAGPRQVETPESGNPVRIGIVIGQRQVISAIDQVLQRGLTDGGVRSDPAAPVSA